MNPLDGLEAKVKQRVIELLGGAEEFDAHAKSEAALVEARWNQNTDAIGRILRAHLFVEHYMTDYLENSNPQLGSIEKARLSFFQKVSLVTGSNRGVNDVLPGIKHLNSIRNKLAHSLDTKISDSDAEVFLSCRLFAALEKQNSRDSAVAKSPLEVLEAFAKHTSIVFGYEHSAIPRAMSQAIQELLPASDA